MKLETKAVRLRAASPSEADALTQLALRSKRFWGYDDVFMAAVEPVMRVHARYLREEHATVAELGGIVAGYSIVRAGKTKAILRDLFVEPASMGNGIGTMLFNEAAAFARSRGATRLELTSDPNAVPFYERFGLRTVRMVRSPYVGNRELPVMAMSLISPG